MNVDNPTTMQGVPTPGRLDTLVHHFWENPKASVLADVFTKMAIHCASVA